MIKLVLFDIDGTLIRSGGAGVKAFGSAFEMVFGIANATESVSFAGRTDTSLVRELFRKHSIEASSENATRFFDAYVFWLDHNLRELSGEVCPGVWEILRDIETSSQPPLVGLLTGNVRLGAEIKLRHFGLWDRFAVGGFADDHEDRGLIANRAKLRGALRLGKPLDGGEVLVIGDTPLDIACARVIGAKVWAVGTGGHGVAELKSHSPDRLSLDLTGYSWGDIEAG